jgi:hypothetical protein
MALMALMALITAPNGLPNAEGEILSRYPGILYQNHFLI